MLTADWIVEVNSMIGSRIWGTEKENEDNIFV